MTVRTVDLLALGMENGGWDGTSKTSRSDRVRCASYIPITNVGNLYTTSVIVRISSSTGKTVQMNLYGYTTIGSSPIFDWYYYNSGTTFDATPYKSTFKYMMCQFRYSDNSSINVSQIVSAVAEIREVDYRWYLGADNRLTNLELPEAIDTNLFVEPYPAAFWRFDSQDRLTLNSESWVPLPEPIDKILTPPYPASFWYLNARDRLVNSLLPEPINNLFTYPYPASLWWYDSSQGRLREILQPDTIPSGAFVNCRNLTYVRIPSTVTRIGSEAFYNTGLTLVRIPAGCTYYPTSFPPGCEIQTYSV